MHKQPDRREAAVTVLHSGAIVAMYLPVTLKAT